MFVRFKEAVNSLVLFLLVIILIETSASTSGDRKAFSTSINSHHGYLGETVKFIVATY